MPIDIELDVLRRRQAGQSRDVSGALLEAALDAAGRECALDIDAAPTAPMAWPTCSR